jgi:integrase
VLALVLLDCGLRISEALGLERDNVNLDSLVLRVAQVDTLLVS